MTDHGAATIKDWMRELIATARAGRDFETSAGADPGRSYAYLEFHRQDGTHSMLVFSVDHDERSDPWCARITSRGAGTKSASRMYQLVPAEDRPQR
jgi:hypothetical protein